ncbi:PREDICTED: protein WVD2-like 7 isoform X2 [Nelumbo nucifera]|uniref:Protein WVD2-like 7 isoform X2 n=1 Tax=Nelumbo nucifera TaxID=4432 RepID=A0A1U8B1Q6_NELNU|nr:PREDICTED: protein WVD2-like 7 isoform X2 [Nelumbo nucifera]
MAGEIEEPISFKAGSLHSGSISFGRFEGESLAWERRSSFSHNRYLEEVEKYSTPGSVTKKKAYFEAHFKKKGFPRQISCGTEYQSDENDVLDHVSYMEELENTNEGSYFAHYDESPHGSYYHGEYDVTGYDGEGEEFSPKFQMELSLTDENAVLGGNNQIVELDTMEQNQFLNNVDEPSDDGLQHVEPGETHQIKSEITTLLVKDEPEMEVKYILASEVENVDTLPKSTNPSTTKSNCMVGKADSPSLKISQKSSLKDSENLKTKLNQENKSEKDTRAKKVGSKSQPAGSEKEECQTANRPKRTVNSSKTSIKSSSAVFVFKSDERAERRKEFYMKLEKKMHAKEVEMNEIQARTQEETEAEIKQFRRSLNFKATPMPSFYRGAASQGSDAKKAVSNTVKPTKSQSKTTSPVSRTASRSQASTKAGNQNLSASESADATAQPQPSEAADFPTIVPTVVGGSSPTSSPIRNHAPQTGKRTEAAGKKEKEKVKDPNVQKQQGSETGKVKKERLEQRRVVEGVGRSSNSDVVRKSMKGVSMGMGVGGSGIGHLVVDVAS